MDMLTHMCTHKHIRMLNTFLLLLSTHSFTSSPFSLFQSSTRPPLTHQNIFFFLLLSTNPRAHTFSNLLFSSSLLLFFFSSSTSRRKAESIFTRFSELTKRPAAVKKALDSLLIVRNKVDAWVDKMPQARTLLLPYLRTYSSA